MTPEARQKLFAELMQAVNEPSDYDLVIERLLDLIDERDKQIADLVTALERIDEITERISSSTNKKFDVLFEQINALVKFFREHNDNLMIVFDIINEGERVLFDGNKGGVMQRNVVSGWYYKIRKAFYDILNPATSGKFTAANAGTGATAPAEAE